MWLSCCKPDQIAPQEIGLDATIAVRIFNRKVVNTRSIPFELKAEDTRLEALLLDGLESPATALEDNWGDKMKNLVRERLAARKTHG